MNVSDILEKAADLLTPEGAWTQEVFARDANNDSVCANAEGAVCWCAAGAISCAAPGFLSMEAFEARAVLYDVLPCAITLWNDAPERTQSEVVAKLREAAALAREQGK